MPRRNYDSSRGRRRPAAPNPTALAYLAAEMAYRYGPPITTDGLCVVCGIPLPRGWRYPEHARCRPED